LTDTIKHDSISSHKAITSAISYTGDSEKAAHYVADVVGIKKVFGTSEK
jgi:Cd2+/Zn2+-exporting ATPase